MSFVLKWHATMEPRCSWFIRGIDAEGRFYGEVLAATHRNVIGQLTSSDLARLTDLASRIRTANEPVSDCVGWRGLLAEGESVSAAITFVRYHDGDENHRVGARLFLEWIQILKPYVGT